MKAKGAKAASRVDVWGAGAVAAVEVVVAVRPAEVRVAVRVAALAGAGLEEGAKAALVEGQVAHKTLEAAGKAGAASAGAVMGVAM